MSEPTETKLEIIVVGAGIGGLSFAIEAHRRGHQVRIFERRPEEVSKGEIVVISKSALQTPIKWPNFSERLWNTAAQADWVFKKWDGTDIGPITGGGDSTERSLDINRGALHTLLREYATEQGLRIEYSANGQEFFELEDKAGIVFTDGRKVTGDLVIAADGIGSKSWKLFAGTNTSPVSSGFVLYRTTFPTVEALKDPVVAKEFQGYTKRGFFFAGPDAHIVCAMTGDTTCWMLTCRDHESNAEESWSKPTTIDNALEAVKDWDPFVPALLKSTPNGTCFDWKMMWRNPQPNWVSTGGRIVQLGDAAHPFLPTSGSGATMAMEDAWSLAACLEIGGKDNLPLATVVHNKLRFERVASAQKLGFKNREAIHKTDWDHVAKHPELLRNLFYRKWINEHDPAQYAAEKYECCAEHVQNGTPFVNTNYVPGYTYKPWTVQELLEASARNVPVEDEGDWS